MIRTLLLLMLPFAAQAESLRIATFNTELSRDGPGVLLRDIRRGDPQVAAVVSVLAETKPDIVALQSIDWDLDGLALGALTQALDEAGLSYPFAFAAQPNAGLETILDLDGDGETSGPGDAQGWGKFTGQSGIAVLSRYPIQTGEVRSLTSLLWRDLPGATLPQVDGVPFPSKQAQEQQRLSSTAHWIVPIEAPGGLIDVLTFHATPPVFDGPEDRNGLRNADEIRLWSLVLNGELGPSPKGRFVIAGDANLDPNMGEGRKGAIRNLLNNTRLQNPNPLTPDGSPATVRWKGVGEMRVDYVLPSAGWQILASGIYWPSENIPGRKQAEAASRHRLGWVDLVTD